MDNVTIYRTTDPSVTYRKEGMAHWCQSDGRGEGPSRVYMDERSWNVAVATHCPPEIWKNIDSIAAGNPRDSQRRRDIEGAAWEADEIYREDREIRRENRNDFILTLVIGCVMVAAIYYFL